MTVLVQSTEYRVHSCNCSQDAGSPARGTDNPLPDDPPVTRLIDFQESLTAAIQPFIAAISSEGFFFFDTNYRTSSAQARYRIGFFFFLGLCLNDETAGTKTDRLLLNLNIPRPIF